MRYTKILTRTCTTVFVLWCCAPVASTVSLAQAEKPPGRRALVSIADSGSGGVKVLDISAVNPGTAEVMGAWSSSCDVHAAEVFGATAYLANGDCGLVILDLSHADKPVRVGGIDNDAWWPPYGLVDLAVSPPYVFAVGNGLRVLDVSNPSAVKLKGTYDPPGGITAIAVQGSFVYLTVAGWSAEPGLHVLDVADPSRPERVGWVAVDGGRDAYDVALSGSRAYYTDDWAGLVVVDVSTPDQPTVMSTNRDWGAGMISTVAVNRSIAFVAESGEPGRLFVVDVSAGSEPRLLHEVDLPNGDYSRDLEYADGRLYSAYGALGLFVWHINAANYPLQSAQRTDLANAFGVAAYLDDATDFRFRPESNGHSMENTKIFRSEDMFRQMFGDHHVSGVDGSMCATASEAFKNWREAADGWSCVGFSSTSLLAFTGRHQPNAGIYSVSPQTSLYSVSDLASYSEPIAYYSGIQATQEYIDDYLAQDRCADQGRGILDQLETAIANGESLVLNLAYDKTKNLYHAVVPYMVRHHEGNHSDVWVYDSESPGERLRVSFTVESGRWKWHYRFSGSLNNYGERAGGCDDLYATTIQTITTAHTPLFEPCAAPAAGQTHAGSTGNVLVYMPSGPGSWIEDAQGRRVGTEHDGLVNELPGAVILPQVTGHSDSLNNSVLLPPADYVLTLSNESVTATSKAVSVFTDGRMLTVGVFDNVVPDPVRINLTQRLDAFTRSDGDGSVFARLVEERSDGSRVGVVSVRSDSARSLTGSFDGDHALVEGGDATYRVTFQRIGHHSGIFASDEIRIGGPESHKVRPFAWDNLTQGAATVDVDSNGDGRVDRTFELENKAIELYLPSLQKAS